MSLYYEDRTMGAAAAVLKPMPNVSLAKSALIAPPAAKPVPKITIVKPPPPAPKKFVARNSSPAPLPGLAIATSPAAQRPAPPKLRPVARTAPKTAPTLSRPASLETAIAPAAPPSKFFPAGGAASQSLANELFGGGGAAPEAPASEEYAADDRGAVGVSIEAPDPIWYAAAAAAGLFALYMWRKRSGGKR